MAEWDAAMPMLLDRMRGDVPGVDPLPLAFDAVLTTDLCVHADDVLAAIGRTPDRNRAATGIAFATYAFGVDYRLRALGLPALGFRYDGKERTVGEGPPATTLTASRWELLRVVAGRRSRAQIAALEWTGDPEPYLAVLPAYGERTDDLCRALNGPYRRRSARSGAGRSGTGAEHDRRAPVDQGEVRPGAELGEADVVGHRELVLTQDDLDDQLVGVLGHHRAPVAGGRRRRRWRPGARGGRRPAGTAMPRRPTRAPSGRRGRAGGRRARPGHPV